MPNQFAPRALTEVVRERTERLRFQFEGEPVHVKEWHGLIDLLGDEATAEFRERYHLCHEVPALVSGFEEIGYEPETENNPDA